MMERIIKKEILKQCELIYTEKTKQFIMGRPIKIFTINKKMEQVISELKRLLGL